MDRRNDLDAVTEAVNALRRYLRANPQACDTVGGIAAWWLPPQAPMNSTAVVRAALATLVGSGEMVRALGPDGQTIYRAAQPASPERLQPRPPQDS